MKCKLCQQRVKDWNGSDPVCFLESWEDNWNCATLNAIRDICYEGQNPMPDGVFYRYCDDMKYAIIDTFQYYDCMAGDEPPRENTGMCFYVEWYKSRGRTDEVLIIGDGEPRRANEEEMLAVIDMYTTISSDKK